MELLKLVIVDDEPILLQGLLDTYDWESMGFHVVGSAMSGEQALEVIREKRPHVVLTDIRMKQITGLMVMEQIQKEEIPCQFVVLSAYRDFEYAKKACDLGAFAYLLKPIEDEKLQETMQSVHRTCMEQLKSEEKLENWEKLLIRDSVSLLQVVVRQYVHGEVEEEKVQEVLDILQNTLEAGDRFITLCADVDLAYKITNVPEYEASRHENVRLLEERIREHFACLKFEEKDGCIVFIVKTQDNATAHELKRIADGIKEEGASPVIAAISKPYKGIRGMRRSYEEAKEAFERACSGGEGSFLLDEEPDEKPGASRDADTEAMIVNAVRKNSSGDLKEAFIQFIYSLPEGEDQQRQYMHKVMVRVEFMIENSYGMTGELKGQFQGYYSNLNQLNAAKTVDVCYKILCSSIEIREKEADKEDNHHYKDYMADALAYIDQHLHEEDLSIVSVATYVYLNPVYFGRVFKSTVQMTFKQYLLKQRMEKAKKLMENSSTSIGDICEQVGISNPSYFSHLFKQYTGKLPSEYKKEYEV